MIIYNIYGTLIPGLNRVSRKESGNHYFPLSEMSGVSIFGGQSQSFLNKNKMASQLEDIERYLD